MSNSVLIKEALSLAPLKSAFQAIADVLRPIGKGAIIGGELLEEGGKAAKIGEKFIKGWEALSKVEKIRALRQLLQDAPKLTKTVGITIGTGANEAKLLSQLTELNTSILSRLNSVINTNKLLHGSEGAASVMNKMEVALENGKRGITSLHDLIPTSEKAIQNQKQINDLLRAGKYQDLRKLLSSVFKNNEKLKPILSDISELEKATDIVSKLGKAGVIPNRQSNILLNSIKTMKAPGVLSGGLGAIQTAPIVGFVALGALAGDTKATVNEQKEIANEIITLLQNLPSNDTPSGKAWDAQKQDVINKLSVVNSIDLTGLETLDTASVDLENAKEMLGNIIDDSSPNNISNKLQNLLEGYLIITAPSFYALYESGSQTITQSVGEATDTMTGWLFGNITAFNQIKSLAQKGAVSLQQSAQKIARNARIVAMKIQQHIIGENTSIATNTQDYSDLIKEAQIFSNVHNLVSSNIKKNIMKKEAAAVFAAIGMVAGWLGGISLATDLGNYITKTYISMGEDWNNLGKNIDDIIEHLNNFISVDSNSDEAKAFIIATNQMIDELKKAKNDVDEYLPNSTSIFQEGLKDKNTIYNLSKEIVDGTAESKLTTVLNSLQKISDIYNVLIDPSSQYYKQFDNTVESYWHGFVEIFDYLTFFTGDAAISEYKRMVYEAKRGQAIAETLSNEINNAIKLMKKTRTDALMEASKPEEKVDNEEL